MSARGAPSKSKKKPAKKATKPPVKTRARITRAEPDDAVEPISWWKAFYGVVRRIPRGRVTTYGVVAALAGHPRSARHVGFALAALKDTGGSTVPWQRVLGARPRNRAAVTIKDPVGGALQRAILESEGVVFDTRGNVSLDRFGWAGPGAKKPAAAPRKRARA
ncbi:MGMT family protein [Polyangium sp. 6x1]|uniref:MGMT family protein n=1 Tax=Polyangium sp. 6x1 TaxID=3042689 RepID=UPI002482AF1E|nr:MGMT family protein [Polyangium sp. 6x1]MDI1450391.1 MGMT family protein [Polyangium sp. 6x1]